MKRLIIVFCCLCFSIERVLADLADIMPDNQAIQDLQTLAEGVKSLEILSQFFALTSRSLK